MNPDSEKVNADLIVSLIQYICVHEGPGAILIFVPGWEDISATMKKLNDGSKFPSCKYVRVLRIEDPLLLLKSAKIMKGSQVRLDGKTSLPSIQFMV